MRAPVFWTQGQGGVLAALLSPLGRLYGFATRAKLATTRPWKAPVPVLCIGNLVAGGAGKTPVAIDLGRRLKARGRSVHFLSRGYGGTEKGPVRVDPAVHDARRVGDEPLLLAAHGPTWVARERRSGCAAAADNGADLIIMDDGFQNPYIAKDFSIVVIDGGFGFGNGRLIPAGPLRESPRDGLARAQAVVIIGEDTTGAREIVTGCGLVPLGAHLRPDPQEAEPSTGPVVAFAGIGRPEKFFETVSSQGYALADAVAFPDHHPYGAADLDMLKKIADGHQARLLTTEKDAKRLPEDFLQAVDVLSVRLHWDDETALEGLLDRIGDV